jgi:uncharacterized membrane protein (DUF2068 family)
MSRPTPSSSVLLWIIAFKAVKTVLLMALGVTLLLAIRSDPVTLVMEIAQAVHLPVTSRLFDQALQLAFRATPRRELALAITAFGYATLMGAEGLGLYWRRTWARWFTIVATSSLLPIEIYEIARETGPVRVAIFVLNLATVWYLWGRKEVFESVPS